MRRNLALYPWYRVLTLEGLCHGLYVIWLHDVRHVPAALIGIFLALGDALLLLAEIPSGILADRLGRRLSLVVGSLIQVAGLALMWLAAHPVPLCGSFLLIALGDAFRNGAHQSLLYETCEALDETERYLPRLARADAVTYAALAGQTLCGGWIASRWGFDAAWALECALAACGVAIAACFQETRGDAQSDGAWLWMPPGRMAGFFGRAALLFAAVSASEFVVQLGTTSPFRNAVLVTVLQVLEALGAATAERCTALQARWMVLGGTVLAAASASSGAGSSCAAVLFFVGGLYRPIFEAAVQRHAPADARAAYASVASTFEMAAKAVLLTLAGTLHD